MNKWEIIKGPIITEKSNDLLEKENKYTFKVSLDANKVEIAEAVEKLFLEANGKLSASLEEKIRNCESEETNPIAKGIFCDLCKNLCMHC